MSTDSLRDLVGVRVGRAVDASGSSGVTVVRFGAARPTVLDVRGGASCTYDTASLSLDATFGRRWAVFFSGGSVYGLDAGRGVRNRLLADGEGHSAYRNPNPVVPIAGATLFDLPNRRRALPDYAELGFAAAAAAGRGPLSNGRVGAGRGARVGKYLGRARSTPGGEGSAAEPVRGLGRVGVLAVVNAIGAVRDPSDGRWRAGAVDGQGRLVPPDHPRLERRPTAGERGTTLVLGIVEADLDRPRLQRLAGQVHAALARSIRPVHSALDGDVVFVASTERRSRLPRERRPGATVDALGAGLARCTERAVLRAVAVRDGGTARHPRPAGGAARPGGPGSGRSS